VPAGSWEGISAKELSVTAIIIALDCRRLTKRLFMPPGTKQMSSPIALPSPRLRLSHRLHDRIASHSLLRTLALPFSPYFLRRPHSTCSSSIAYR